VRPTFVAALRHVLSTLSLNESELIEQCGLDVYLNLRLMRFCFWLICSILSGRTAGPGAHIPPPAHVGALHRVFAPRARKRRTRIWRNACAVCGPLLHGQRAEILGHLVADGAGHVFWVVRHAHRAEARVQEIVRLRQAFFQSRPPRLYTVFVDRIHVRWGTQSLWSSISRTLPRQIMRVEIVGPVEGLVRVASREPGLRGPCGGFVCVGRGGGGGGG